MPTFPDQLSLGYTRVVANVSLCCSLSSSTVDFSIVTYGNSQPGDSVGTVLE